MSCWVLTHIVVHLFFSTWTRLPRVSKHHSMRYGSKIYTAKLENSRLNVWCNSQPHTVYHIMYVAAYGLKQDCKGAIFVRLLPIGPFSASQILCFHVRDHLRANNVFFFTFVAIYCACDQGVGYFSQLLTNFRLTQPWSRLTRVSRAWQGKLDHTICIRWMW